MLSLKSIAASHRLIVQIARFLYFYLYTLSRPYARPIIERKTSTQRPNIGHNTSTQRPNTARPNVGCDASSGHGRGLIHARSYGCLNGLCLEAQRPVALSGIPPD